MNTLSLIGQSDFQSANTELQIQKKYLRNFQKKKKAHMGRKKKKSKQTIYHKKQVYLISLSFLK